MAPALPSLLRLVSVCAISVTFSAVHEGPFVLRAATQRVLLGAFHRAAGHKLRFSSEYALFSPPICHTPRNRDRRFGGMASMIS